MDSFDQESAFDHLMELKKRRELKSSLEEKLIKRRRLRTYAKIGIAATVLSVLGVAGLINWPQKLDPSWASAEIEKMDFIISAENNIRGEQVGEENFNNIDEWLKNENLDSAFFALKNLNTAGKARAIDQYNLSILYLKSQEELAAISLLEKMLAEHNSMMEGRWLLSLIYYQTEKYEKAKFHLSKLEYYKVKEKERLQKQIQLGN